MLPLVFIGGVDIARRCLEALCDNDRRPKLAVGYPPSLAHRSGYASLEDVCATHNVPLLETEDLNSDDSVERIRAVEPELLLVVAWSQIVGAELLGVARHGAFGFHPTALPEGRGRAPIPWTIIKGLERSAVTLFELTEAVDEGPIIAQKPFEIGPHDDASTVYRKVGDLYVELLLEHVDALVAGKVRGTPQRGKASHWPKRSPDEGRIDWSAPAWSLYNWIRGLTHPYPGAYTTLSGNRRLVVWAADLLDVGPVQVGIPGTVLGPMRRAGLRDGGVIVAAREGALALRSIQLEGDDEQPALELFDARVLSPGDVLG